MKTFQTKKTMRFGDLITTVYDACGKQKAKGILRLAFIAHLVRFRDPHAYLLSLTEHRRHSPSAASTLLWRTLARKSRST